MNGGFRRQSRILLTAMRHSPSSTTMSLAFTLVTPSAAVCPYSKATPVSPGHTYAGSNASSARRFSSPLVTTPEYSGESFRSLNRV